MQVAPSPVITRLFQLPKEVLVDAIAKILGTATDLIKDKGESTCFHSRNPAPLSLADYLARLSKWMPAKKDALFLMLVYLQRISDPSSDAASIQPDVLLDKAKGEQRKGSKRHPVPLLNQWTAHRLVLATLLVSSKFISDAYIPQDRASKCAGVDMQEILGLEVEILVQLDFQLLFTLDELQPLAHLLLQTHEDNNADAVQVKTVFLKRPVRTPSPNTQYIEDPLNSIIPLPPFSISPRGSSLIGSGASTTPDELERTPRLHKMDIMGLN